MVISDLDYLESALGDEDALSGSAGVFVGVWGLALGEFTRTWADTKTFSFHFSSGASLAIGLGGVLALAYTPPPSN